MRHQLWLAPLFLGLVACHDAPAAPSGAAGAAPSNHRSPLPLSELRTTDGAIALDNLQGQIDGEQRLAKYRPLKVIQRATIIDLIAMRGQFLGRIADYEDADELAAQLVRDQPGDGVSFLALAKAHSIFHRFPAALEALQTAERLGAPAEQIESQRAAIFQAVGRYDEALAIRQRAAAVHADIAALTIEATVYSERGEIDTAERLFIDAQYHYRDVSPFPVTWLYFLQGQMWMREGNFERARQLFAAAHERLPAYAAAQGHLGETEALLGNRRRAIELLRPLAETSDDPDYAAQLARILADTGEVEESRRWRTAAVTRYDELIARHPEAFADHAAEFWLAAGADPQKALSLAQRNLDVRRTARAYELLLQAALAAHDTMAACQAADAARGIAHPPPGLQTVTAKARASCPG